MIEDLVTEDTQLATEEQIQKEIENNGVCMCIVASYSEDFSFKLSFENIRE